MQYYEPVASLAEVDAAAARKKTFGEAEGGVLFIDEAYSPVDDRNGSFGDEAINTIV